MEQITRKYPVGIQTFERIIQEGYIYLDKTDLVWQLAHDATFIFMSRPRRFGKSLLTSTLESYFKGDKELFKGLKIMDFEKNGSSILSFIWILVLPKDRATLNNSVKL